MSHYTHHIDDSGKEPTIIEINGEPYPEEQDPELHEFNRINAWVAQEAAVLARWEPATVELFPELRRALAEREKMVSGK